MLAARELNLEAAAEFVLGWRSDADSADGRIAGPAAHPLEMLLKRKIENRLSRACRPPVSV
jgi:hypothetical protein